jgi:hypothetical protein
LLPAKPRRFGRRDVSIFKDCGVDGDAYDVEVCDYH